MLWLNWLELHLLLRLLLLVKHLHLLLLLLLLDELLLLGLVVNHLLLLLLLVDHLHLLLLLLLEDLRLVVDHLNRRLSDLLLGHWRRLVGLLKLRWRCDACRSIGHHARHVEIELIVFQACYQSFVFFAKVAAH